MGKQQNNIINDFVDFFKTIKKVKKESVKKVFKLKKEALLDDERKRRANYESYLETKAWLKEQHKKTIEVAIKYKLDTPEKVADFFSFANMRIKEPDFCLLYQYEDPECHRMSPKDLNCFFCACPFYDVDHWIYDKREFGACRLPNPHGERNPFGYWDCTNCTVPHRKSFVIRYLKFTEEGAEIMKEILEGIKKKSD